PGRQGSAQESRTGHACQPSTLPSELAAIRPDSGGGTGNESDRLGHIGHDETRPCDCQCFEKAHSCRGGGSSDGGGGGGVAVSSEDSTSVPVASAAVPLRESGEPWRFATGRSGFSLTDAAWAACRACCTSVCAFWTASSRSVTASSIASASSSWVAPPRGVSPLPGSVPDV